MPEQFTLYSTRYTNLPAGDMNKLALKIQGESITPKVIPEGKGAMYVYRWPDGLTITIRATKFGDELIQHLEDFARWVQQIHGNETPLRATELIRRIQSTTLAIATLIEPERDEAGRAAEVMGRVITVLKPIIFHAGCVYDQHSRLLLAPDRRFDEAAVIGR